MRGREEGSVEEINDERKFKRPSFKNADVLTHTVYVFMYLYMRVYLYMCISIIYIYVLTIFLSIML